MFSLLGLVAFHQFNMGSWTFVIGQENRIPVYYSSFSVLVFWRA
jgi:hypothetical protein